MSDRTSKNVLIILGMHRSGSSALTRMINLHGAKLTGKLSQANAYNERGYWESTEIQRINDEILNSERTAWFDWHAFPITSLSPNKRTYFEDKITRFLVDHVKPEKSPLFVIKDPRICKIFPIWQSALRAAEARVSVIIPFRHPIEVAASLTHRDDLPQNWGFLLWLRYVLDAERFSRGHTRAFLSYDKFIQDWQSSFQDMEKLFQIKWPVPSTSVKAEIKKFLSTDLKHHHWSKSDLDPSNGLSIRTHELYEILEEAERHEKCRSLHAVFDRANSDLERLSSPMEENIPRVIHSHLALEKKLQLINEQEFVDRKNYLALRTSGSHRIAHLFTLNEKIEVISSNLCKKNDKLHHLELKMSDKTSALKVAIQELETQKVRLCSALEETKRLTRFHETQNEPKPIIIPAILRYPARTITIKFRNAIQSVRSKWHAKLIEKSIYFDSDWYLLQYQDVRADGIDPALHYIVHGAKEGRNPSQKFNSDAYLLANPDVFVEKINPLVHYIKHGYAEGRAGVNKIDVLPIGQPVKDHLSKMRFPSAVSTDYLDFHVYDGNQKWRNDRPTILCIAHVAGKNIFGGERSFLDIIEALHSIDFNVVSTVPNHYNQAYLDQIRQTSTQVVAFRYKWWTKGMPVSELVIATFERIIRKINVDAVHINTIMLREPLIAARRMRIPTVVHVREIIEHDEALAAHIGEAPEVIKQQLLSLADFVVANSQTTGRSLKAPSKTFVVENCVDIQQYKGLENNCSDNINIAMISSNIPKKGIHDFVSVAQKLSPHNLRLKFQMVGPINEYVRALQDQQALGNIPECLQFPGYYADSSEAIKHADIVVNLSHFQESFGRTILESMMASKPVVAYDWGALRELVQHEQTGFLASFKDIDAIARFIAKLANEPKLRSRMGKAARAIAVANYSKKAYTTKLKQAYDKILDTSANRKVAKLEALSGVQVESARVSVIIPNYNYAQFLDNRLESILNQTITPFEILFLDDHSTDSSVQVAKEILDQNKIPYRLFQNSENKGTYRQWLKGIREARGNYIWIAEADDSCEPDFLERLLTNMSDHRTVLAYCQSLVLDEQGTVIRSRNVHHTDDVDEIRWLSDYHEIGIREVVDYLVYRNTIPNVSACLFRSDAIQDAIEDIKSYRFCGDWSLYCRLLQHGDIAFVADPLNHFRRHSCTVTRSHGRSEDYLQELLRIKQQQLEDFPIHLGQLSAIKRFIDTDYQIDGLRRNSEWDECRAFFSLYSQKISRRRRFVMLTTNNGSFNGGSEMLWIESAMRLRAQGHDVMVIIKDWDPAPSFLGGFQELGISIKFKDGHEIDIIRNFAPDLIVVSTGDQDEGTEYFGSFIEENRPYVIVNQLTKQTEYWPLRETKLPAVNAAYKHAVRVFFTCWNNHRVMESRLGCSITNAELHYNPYHIDRDVNLPFPSFDNGLKIAMPAKLLHIHKGQKLIIELMSHNHWKRHDITISLYGEGPDEEEFKSLVAKKGLDNIHFLPRVPDLLTIWRENHVILMSSFMEGLPIVLVSAMLCSRVPILTDIGGHAEVVENNVSGFIASKPTTEDLEDALSRAVERIDELEQIGRKARKSILNYLPSDPVEDFIHKLDVCCLEANKRQELNQDVCV